MKTYRSLAHWGAFTAEVENGALVGIRPFEHDPAPTRFNEVWMDPAMQAMRVADPVVRKGYLDGDGGVARGEDTFVRVGWDEALDLVADRLRDTIDTHGIESIFGGSYGWSSAGRVHHARTLVHRFLGTLGPFTSQTGNYSFGAAMAFLPWVLGTGAAVTGIQTGWDSIVEHTEVLLTFGGLPAKNYVLVSGGVSQHRHAEIVGRLAQGNMSIINVSPFRGDLPEDLPHDWLAPRPNTDTALLLALCHDLAIKGHADREFLDRYCEGYDRFKDYLLGRTDGIAKTPDWAARVTGLPVERIQALADMLPGRRVMLTATWSLQRARHGEQPYWAIIALAAMLGQIGLPGGGFGFGHGSSAGMGNRPFGGPLYGLESDTRRPGLSIPAARVTELMLNPGGTFRTGGKTKTYPDIRLVYWAGGNPFHHHQDLNQLRTAFRRPDTVIVHENYWTATARHADIVLPATIPLERNDIGGSSRERYIFAMHKACEPFAQSRNDYDIFAALAERLGVGDGFTEGRSENDWLRFNWDRSRADLAARGIDAPDFDTFWEQGYFEMPKPQNDFVLMDRFRSNPEANPLPTPSGLIEIFSTALHDAEPDEQPGHPAWLDPEEWLGAPLADQWPLHLLTPQPERRLHGQMDASTLNQEGRVEGREVATIHPDDAAARGIRDGDAIRLFNDRGACFAIAQLSHGIRPGVVSLPTGSTYDPQGSADLNSNPNVLTRDIGSSLITQGCAAQSCLIDIARHDEPLPALRVYSPPPIVERG